MELKVLDLDNHIIIVYKPEGVLSQEDISHDPDMLNMVKQYIKEKFNKPGEVYTGLVHRLDRNTAGVMVFARTSKAAARLSEEIKTHTMSKNYIAVVIGALPKSDKYITLKNYLKKNEKENKSYVTKNPNDKEAILEYRPIETIMNGNTPLTLVDIHLITGRHHQIRCQFANMGYPLYGDIKYGSKINVGNYYALAAYKLNFTHPTLKEERNYFYFEPRAAFTKFYKNNDFLRHYHLN